MPEFSKPKSMVDQIYASISRAITTGELEPGARLVEQQLQKDFGVSRAPIREAIRLLEADGLVVVDAYKKKSVRNLTREDLTENIPVLACLESLAAKIAAARITPPKLCELEEINRQIGEQYKAGNYTECAELNFSFHRALLHLAGNKALRRAISSIIKSTIWLWLANQYYSNNSIIPSSIDEHGAILEAMEKGDAALAESRVREHIENVLERFLRQSNFDEDGIYQFIRAKDGTSG